MTHDVPYSEPSSRCVSLTGRKAIPDGRDRLALGQQLHAVRAEDQDAARGDERVSRASQASNRAAGKMAEEGDGEDDVEGPLERRATPGSAPRRDAPDAEGLLLEPDGGGIDLGDRDPRRARAPATRNRVERP